MNKYLILSLLLIMIPLTSLAESVWELSLPGEALLPYDAHTLALGGATEARWDIESGLPDNPAQLVGLEGFTFATVLQWRHASRNLAEGGSWDESRQGFPGVQISLQLPYNVRFGIGYRADLRSRGSFTVEDVEIEAGGSDTYEVRFNQNGGHSRFPMTLSMPIGEKHRLGVGLALTRGNLNQEWYFDFPTDSAAWENSGLGYQDRKIRRQAHWRGTSLVLGLQSHPISQLTLSLHYEGATALRGEDREEVGGDDDVIPTQVTGHMPARWSAGGALELPGNVVTSLQWSHHDWSTYETPVSMEKLLDVDYYSVGLEFRSRQNDSGLIPFPLRLGMRRGRQPHLDPLTDSEIGETLFSFGSGINVQEGRGSIDMAFFWQMFDVSGGEGESRYGFALSLRTSEIWKKRITPF